MAPRTSKTISRLAFAVLLLSFLACRVQFQTANSTFTTTPSKSFPVGVATVTLQSIATPVYISSAAPPTVAVSISMTPALPLVTITAINGNLYIRRGSGSDFNPIGVLSKGQMATAMGRDILDQWLYIPIPSQAGKFGWVSTLTIYSSVSGQTMDLPVVDSDLAVPAYIQNCSTHNMIVQPVGVILPPFYQYPDSVVQFDPGEYSILDYDKPKYNPNSNQGIAVDLVEGELYQITAMGTAAQHKCPVSQ
ncbi:MAG: hypothetical protein WCA79_14485 [Anaerolineales bacterium]